MTGRREFLLSAAALPLAAARELPSEPSVQIEEICRVPSYCEGVVFDHSGFAYVSWGRFISRIGPDGKPSNWAETGAPNGHKILADGTHLVCDASQHGVLHLDASGKVLGKAASECDGKPLRGPNDLTLDPRGGFYFTDPGGSGKDKPIGTVHHVDRAGKVTLCASGLAFPNGIVLRPGGKKLLVGESQHNRILEFDVRAPGRLSPQRVFCNLPAKGPGQIDNQPDGICLDAAGNLYVAHYGMRQVQVVNPKGQVVRRYPGGNLTTSNVAFGGDAMDTLFITGAVGIEGKDEGGFFRLRLPGVRGLKILPARKA